MWNFHSVGSRDLIKWKQICSAFRFLHFDIIFNVEQTQIEIQWQLDVFQLFFLTMEWLSIS